MDDDLNDDQQVLLDASARFIEQTCPLARLRNRAFDDPTFAAAYRRQAAELGWYSLVVGDDDEIAVQRNVRPTGQTVPVHLGDDRDTAVPQVGPPLAVGDRERHVLLQRPGTDLLGFLLRRVDVVARAERRSGTAAVSYTHLTLPTNREV